MQDQQESSIRASIQADLRTIYRHQGIYLDEASERLYVPPEQGQDTASFFGTWRTPTLRERLRALTAGRSS